MPFIIYTINEAEQAIVTQFGKPVGGAVTEAGIHFKIPIIQTVIKFDKRILEWDGSANEIPSLVNKYIFRENDIRGKVIDDFPPEIVVQLGKGFGTFVKRNDSG